MTIQCAIYRLVEAERNLNVVPIYVFLDVINVIFIVRKRIYFHYIRQLVWNR